MKKVITILLLTFAAPAFADHHIAHTFMHLDEAERNLNKVRNAINAMPICPNWTETQIKTHDKGVKNYVGKTQTAIDETRVALENVLATWADIQLHTSHGHDVSASEALLKDQLFTARRILTQPAWPVAPGEANSGEFWGGYIMVSGKYLIHDWRADDSSTVCDEAGRDMAQIILSATVTLRWLNIAAWHIFDATNEMVYKDEEFICAGPNNHCE